MSIESFFLSRAADKLDVNGFGEKIDRLTNTIEKFIDIQPEYMAILKSNKDEFSSNQSDGTIIDKSIRIPAGFRFVVEDFNINFTTVAGTIRITILDGNDNEKIDVLRDITSSTNGTGRTVLDAGERIAVLGQSAGAGVFGVYLSGFLQKMRSQ